MVRSLEAGALALVALDPAGALRLALLASELRRDPQWIDAVAELAR